ncbi:LysR substrate-binding domain-containing protein [Amphritea balenae]|uniref:LysR family transcriptional regulator n=1 Tax=Amphritea balenae TaxID=452629 RepID=A0A3P1SV24_9GAMM|nr:LysR substrate-binding domain-containing protein [Amphritea balenae]RRD00003.1 LysR family transcriptional regulator [Amphritea balenae]GGK75790.1 LysR family transcriptional regulator [Amphritea balenae]
MNITVRQLQCFREVMRTGSISEAARTLQRTQPAVSNMIATLEEELGVELFERQRGRLIRKPEAHYFLEESEQILERLNKTARTMKEIAGLELGRLKIACMPAASNYLMPRLIAEFVRDKPRVNVSMMMRDSSVIEEWVASQQYDIGLAETPPPNRALSALTFDLKCVCALPVNDPLANKAVITPQDLDNLPLATLQEDHPNYQSALKAFKRQGATLNQRFELLTFQPALKLVEENLCYCICDPMTASGYLQRFDDRARLVFRPFVPEVILSVSVLTPAHRPASVLANSFTQLVTQQLEELNAQFYSE